MTRRSRTLLSRAVVAVAGAAVAGAFLLPTVWMLGSALRPEREIFAYLSPLSVHSIVPGSFTLDNFRIAANTAQFGRAVFNSIFVSGMTTILGLAVCAPAAFALAVMRFPLRNAVFVLLFISFTVPFDLVAIPLSSIFRDGGLGNTYTALILPGIGNGFAILLLRQFFLGLPHQIREAARVDGAGWLRVLWELYLPLAKPALVTAGITLFIFQWQSYLWPLLISSQPQMQLGSVTLASLLRSGISETAFGAVFAGAAILAAVPAVLMLLFQRTFIESIASSGSTG